ncbi:MAG: endonuclease III [Candidatus Melainabacteria bacterium]|nr:endonuclease III [Candidatus Melainabacteria bacterium]
MKKTTPISSAKPTERAASVQQEVPMETVLDVLNATYDDHPMDLVTEQNPYKVLVGCILSLRTKDEATIPACERLFALADTPESMLTLSAETIQQAIFPVGFYRNKSETILSLSRTLLDQFNGQVPNSIEELLTLKGVGRKTANLVVGLGHRLPAICVDVHVHRICNRLGYIATTTPEETEMVLRQKLPLPYWSLINKLLVLHGREVCKPIGARCDVCPVASHCLQIDVKKRKPPEKPLAKLSAIKKPL